MMKKWLLGCGLASVCISLVAWSGVSRADENGLRQVGRSAKMIDIEYIKGRAGQPPLLSPGFESFSDHLSGAFPFETTGFEADAGDGGWCPGYVCGPDFASCNVKVTGNLADTCGVNNPNPQRFWMSGSSRSCSEPHIDTLNPHLGSQHLRYEVDNATDGRGDITPFPCPSGGAGTLTGSCRLSLFSPVICADPATCSNDTSGEGCCTTPLPIAPSTMTAWVAKASGISHYLEISTQTPITSGFAGSKIAWDTDFGTLLIYVPGTGDVDTGVYYPVGADSYREMVQVIDVCTLQYVYFYDGELLGTAPITSGLPTGIEQYVILSDNSAGVIDIDDIKVVRDTSTSPCDSTCGNGILELGEDCDGDAGVGTNCVGCESDCTCSSRNCEFPGFSCPLSNGDNGPYVSAGGWWVYDSDTPAFAVNTCGSEGVDTFLMTWSLSPTGIGFERGDDDCDGGAKTQPFESDSDPLAPCYNRAGPVCVCTGATCTNEEVSCPTGDLDCLTIFLCFGGGNDGGQCNIANENDDCTDFCVGGLNGGQNCSANASLCETLTCVSGPFAGTSCTAEGTSAGDCSGRVCTGCNTPGLPCIDDFECGNEVDACQQRDGDCALAGACSRSGSCLPDSFCSGDIDTPFESCLCLDYSYYWGVYYYYYNDYDASFYYTTKGTTWLIQLDYFGALPVGSTININVEKRFECSDDEASIIATNICCNLLDGGCALAEDDSDCSNESVFIPNKFCSENICPAVEVPLGACCDAGIGIQDCGQIGPVSAASCAEQGTSYAWTSGSACKELDCPILGACCDHDTQTCTSHVTEGHCATKQSDEAQRTWTKAEDCSGDGGTIDCFELTGACCDFDLGTCTSDVLEGVCDVPGDPTQRAWFKSETCVGDGGTIDCPEHTGACCDYDVGSCTSFTLESECDLLVPDPDQRLWSKNDQCVPEGGTVTCPEHTGACCDRLFGNCTQVLESECELVQLDPNQRTWTKNTGCSQVDCFPVDGACCDSGNGMPGAASCTGTTFADCQCETCTWAKGGNCADLKAAGDCLVNPIPTVSEWGLVILTLLLLTGAKIYFGRRRVATA